jgi:hypothetical protein
VRTVTFSNGIANALFGARKFLPRHATASTVATDAAITATATNRP